ncbi:MAG: carbon-nitrogen hydrolase family protein [Thermocladium sp.]
MRFHLFQAKSRLGDVNYNLDRLVSYMKANCGNGDVVVTPELYLPGYMSRDLHFNMAEPMNGNIVKTLTAAAAETGCTIITGMGERDEVTDVIYNAAIVIGPNGLIAKYRKRHLPSYGVFDEARYFGIGEEDAPVFDINGARLGLAICYDAFYPEISRSLMLRGAKIHVYISAAPDMSKNHFEAFMRARAMENVVYTIYVNTVGQYDGLGFFGGSHAVDPLGEVIIKAKYYDEDYVTVDIDPSMVTRYRSIRPILKDYQRSDREMLNRIIEAEH